jgi:hypothetical protein
MSTCTATNCTKPAVARGLCGTHYMRQQRHSATTYAYPTPAELALLRSWTRALQEVNPHE